VRSNEDGLVRRRHDVNRVSDCLIVRAESSGGRLSLNSRLWVIRWYDGVVRDLARMENEAWITQGGKKVVEES